MPRGGRTGRADRGRSIVRMRIESTPSRGRSVPRPMRAERDLSRPLPPALSWIVLLAFVAALVVTVAVLDVSWWLPAWYGVLSLAAFTSYGADKGAARRGAPRMSEHSLLTIGLVGGWPGALVAQQLFRHKTRKRTFRRAFWTTVVVNVLALAALVIAITVLPIVDYSGMLQ